MENEKGVSLVNFWLKLKFLHETNNEFFLENIENVKNLFYKWCKEILSLKEYLKLRHQERLLSVEK